MIPPDKRTELCQTEVDRQACRVIDTLVESNQKYIDLLREALDLLNLVKPHLSASEKLNHLLLMLKDSGQW